MKTASLGLGRIKSFFDNYKALGIVSVLLIASLCARSQRTYDTARGLQKVEANGYSYIGLEANQFLKIPRDTIALSARDYPGLAYKGGQMWIFNGQYWVALTAGIITGPGGNPVTVTWVNQILCFQQTGVDDQCFDFYHAFGDAELSQDEKGIVFRNLGGDSLKRVDFPITYIKDSLDLHILKYGKTATFYVTAGTGGAGGRLDTAFIVQDTLLVLEYIDGFKDSLKIQNGTTNVTASLPLSITGTSNVNPNVVADTTSGTAPSLVTQYQRKKTSDSLLALINTKLNITDTANIRLRPIAGTNITITGTYPNLTFNSTSSGGTYTANAPITLTGSAFGADTTSGTAAALVTQYQRKKTSDSLMVQIVLRLNISDTASMLSSYKTSFPRQSISLTTTGSGAATYNNSTGVLNIPTPSGSAGWALTGNAATDSTNNFIGTTDVKPLNFRTNNIVRGMINSVTGNWGIGAAPSATSTDKLYVLGSIVATGGGSGVSYRIASGTAIRTNVASGGIMYIDGDNGLTGTIFLRSTTVDFGASAVLGNAAWTNLNDIGVLNGASRAFKLSTKIILSHRVDSSILKINDDGSTPFQSVGINGSYNVITDANSSGLYSLTNFPRNKSLVLDIHSTTKAFRPPSMTSAEKGAIVLTGVVAGTITPGSGGTNNTYYNVPLTGGSGSGATARVFVSGGIVNTVDITNMGSGYAIGNTLSATLPGLTGFVYTITDISGQPGITLYCTDCTATDASTGVMQTYNGTTWKNNW